MADMQIYWQYLILQRNRFANCCFPAQSIIQDREKIQSREDNIEFVVADYEAGCEFLS